MAKILLLYSTVDGHTYKICQRIKTVIEAESPSDEVSVETIDAADDLDLESFDKIVIGASIRYGKHRPAVFRFIEQHLEVLEQRPNAFFTVNVVARKPDKNRPHSNPYMQKFLQSTPWQPRLLGVFAGKIDYQRYGFLDRNMIRFIMWLTKGPTDPATNIEFTLWSEVDAFAHQVATL